MSMIEWAKKEVEIACKHENPDRKDDEFDYGCACYESALKAFESLCSDGHSGFSIKMTQQILNRLINGQPLTPIEDTEDAWSDILDRHDDCVTYQCKRQSSLFKDVYDDGTVKYHDNDLCYAVNVYDHNNTYYLRLVSNIIHEMKPIKMPYMPGKPIKVFCYEFLCDPKNGDFDTVGVLYAQENIDGIDSIISIERYFREPHKCEETVYNGWVEISLEEYNKRLSSKVN